MLRSLQSYAEAHGAFSVTPDPTDKDLSTSVIGSNERGETVETHVVTERPLTLFLNNQEIVTVMTIGDHPDLMAIGYLLNQNMLDRDDEITSIDYDADLSVVIVRTLKQTNHEQKLQKRVRTSGCGQGTVFGDVMDGFEGADLSNNARLKTSDLYHLTKRINTQPSLYLAAGAIHGCVLCSGNIPVAYMEDVGRHNAIDKIAGWAHREQLDISNATFYTTGRLTSEMVIKTVIMGIPILISRSGFTAWGVELARKAGLTLIGRARGERFTVLSGAERVIFDGGKQ